MLDLMLVLAIFGLFVLSIVIHEFAHCLDGLDGEMGGSLTFDDPATTF